jgi:hypothetical protein
MGVATSNRAVKPTIQTYSKAIVAAIGVVLTGLNIMYGADPRVQMAITIAIAAGVYQIPNKR